MTEVCRFITVFRLGLYDHLPDPAEIDKLGYVGGTHIGLQGIVDIGNMDAENFSAASIEVKIKLLLRRRERRGHTRQLRTLLRFGDEFFRQIFQILRIAASHALNVELESTRGAQPGNRRGGHRHDNSFLDRGETAAKVFNNRESAGFFALPLRVVFQRREQQG